MSNSSDPYPPIERIKRITKEVIELIKQHKIKLLIITKSDIVTRDIDILKRFPSAVSISITSFNKIISRKLEPAAPEPEKRFEALKLIKKNGIPVILRIDPIIPYLTEKDSIEILKEASFVDHVVFSTLKLKRDGYKRLISVFPELKDKWYIEYFKRGSRIKNSFYLEKSKRISILQPLIEIANKIKKPFGLCREGLPFIAKSCDGSHLLKPKISFTNHQK